MYQYPRPVPPKGKKGLTDSQPASSQPVRVLTCLDCDLGDGWASNRLLRAASCVVAATLPFHHTAG